MYSNLYRLKKFVFKTLAARKNKKACYEIANVLIQNGTALVGNYIPTHNYAEYFKKAGLKVNSSKNYIKTAYSLTWMIKTTKR